MVADVDLFTLAGGVCLKLYNGVNLACQCEKMLTAAQIEHRGQGALSHLQFRQEGHRYKAA